MSKNWVPNLKLVMVRLYWNCWENFLAWRNRHISIPFGSSFATFLSFRHLQWTPTWSRLHSKSLAKCNDDQKIARQFEFQILREKLVPYKMKGFRLFLFDKFAVNKNLHDGLQVENWHIFASNSQNMIASSDIRTKCDIMYGVSDWIDGLCFIPSPI